ncbi:hypothetical protein BDZ94DRAFT_225173 [Collybia nuda]|uniref:DUF6533 domain-containing protein n=1 Tax=Collybia nuda TaxID=64659 RepID=A0A9P5XVD5_9AGAR|nr:hypothetical protein BDZ94DRAFT_225173 [Collybia nuda]
MTPATSPYNFPPYLLNPFTPMAFLPPDDAYRNTIMGYVIVGGLSVFVWDFLIHIPTDYRLVVKHNVKFPTVIYYLSRWSTLFYAVSTVVFQTAPIGNCAASAKIPCSAYHVAVSSTALLFFLRVRAIFEKDRTITIVFFVLWLAVLGGSVTAIPSLSGVHIGKTKYCTFSSIGTYRSAANITLAIFDTCVFIAITWRILRDQFTYEVGDQTKSNFFGRGLPAFSRALLQDGQKYYMVAMIANLLVLIMEFAPGIPLIYRTIFLATGVVLTNIMACRVFRHTKMGCKCKDSQAMSALVFNTNNIASVRIRNHINTVGVHSTLSDVGDISSRNVEGALSGYPTSEKLLAYQRR